MTFTIEPMITLGTYRHDMWADGWTVRHQGPPVDGPVRAHGGRHRVRLRDSDPAVTDPRPTPADRRPRRRTTTPTSPAAGCAPAVFGAMDGLVTNIGADRRRRRRRRRRRSAIVLTGTAGLVAGAISMALGEYTSRAHPERAGRGRGGQGAPRTGAQPRGRGRGAGRSVWIERGPARPTWPARWPTAVHGQPGGGAAGARPGGAGRRPGRAAQPVDGGDLVVRLLLDRRADPAAAVPARVSECCGRRWSPAASGCSWPGRCRPGSPGRPGGSAGCASSCSARWRPGRRT